MCGPSPVTWKIWRRKNWSADFKSRDGECSSPPWHVDSRWTQDWRHIYLMKAEVVAYMKFYFEKEQKKSCYLDRLTVSVISLSSRSWQLASFLLRMSSTIWWSWGQARRSFSISTLPRNPVPPVISTVLSR